MAPGDTSTTLYWISGSGPSRRVQTVLELKGIPFESKLLTGSKGEHKSEDMLKLNPRGQVPVMVDNGRVISESMASMLYLEEAYPHSKPLLPADLDTKAKVLQRLLEVQNFDDVGREPILMQLRGVVKTEEDKQKFDEGVKKLGEEYAKWEAMLTDDFLVGSELTLADVMLAVGLTSAWRFGCNFDNFPKLKAYRERCEDFESFKKSLPPHWKEQPNRKTWLAGLDA